MLLVDGGGSGSSKASCCAGVRVLFQVAVVLVRRVLGRAEQRQECSGQMETLERLRGVGESQGLEDDASFMAEVPSTISLKHIKDRAALRLTIRFCTREGPCGRVETQAT